MEDMIIWQIHVNKSEISGACLRVRRYFHIFVQIKDTEFRAHQNKIKADTGFTTK